MHLQEPLGVDLSIGDIVATQDLLERNSRHDIVTSPHLRRGGYIAGFAASPKAIRAAQRLRYEVFNLELGEGLAEAHITGVDQDRFDDQMTHLVLLHEATGQVVGTYRLQTILHGFAHNGVYSALEYDLGPLEAFYEQSMECGRACVAKGHRSITAVMLLWAGIGVFMNRLRMRYIFGCCSLTTTDPLDGWRAMKTLRARGSVHPSILVEARPEFSCGSPGLEFDPATGEAIALPKLFSAYMRLGGHVVSEPALDREFRTVDFLVLLDAFAVNMSSLDVVT